MSTDTKADAGAVGPGRGGRMSRQRKRDGVGHDNRAGRNRRIAAQKRRLGAIFFENEVALGALWRYFKSIISLGRNERDIGDY